MSGYSACVTTQTDQHFIVLHRIAPPSSTFGLVQCIPAECIAPRRNIEAAQFSVGGGDLSKLYARAPGLIPVEEFAQEDREVSRQTNG